MCLTNASNIDRCVAVYNFRRNLLQVFFTFIITYAFKLWNVLQKQSFICDKISRHMSICQNVKKKREMRVSHVLYYKDNTEEFIFKWRKWFASYCMSMFRLGGLFKCNVIGNQHYIQNYFVVQYHDAILACYGTKKHKQTKLQNMINQWAKPN